jgi:hypothetical protein
MPLKCCKKWKLSRVKTSWSLLNALKRIKILRIPLNIKESEQYVCLKCEHTKSQIRKCLSRTRDICSYTESPTANTLFYKVKFG